MALLSGAALSIYPADYDVVIVGGTPGGIMAAIETARMGKKAVILERTERIGGLPANGLGATDIATRGATTGLFSEFTNAIKNSINRTGFGFVFSSDNAQHKGQEIKNITVYKARNLLSSGNEFEPIYKTLVVTYIERMLRFYSGDFKQDKILKFFSNNPNS